jgi:hypothetical protein
MFYAQKVYRRMGGPCWILFSKYQQVTESGFGGFMKNLLKLRNWGQRLSKTRKRNR